MDVMRRNRAFTLVELMVVILIVGLLAAMLSVGLNTARRTALQVTCVNNLRQLGLALGIYLQEESEGYLPKVSGTNANDDTKDWRFSDYKPDFIQL